MQTKKYSFIEAIVNVLIRYSVAITSQLLVFPWFDIRITIGDNLLIGAYFTLISIVRSYVIRRLFTKKTEVKMSLILSAQLELFPDTLVQYIAIYNLWAPYTTDYAKGKPIGLYRGKLE